MKHITFYLDFISPYAYLAFEELPQALMGLSYSVTYFAHRHAQAQTTHGRIVALFRAGAPESVELAVRGHILEAADAYARFLQETYPEVGDSA